MFYSDKETVLTVLKVGVALEIWQRTFASFPRARVRVGILLVVALLATAIGILTVPKDVPSYYALMSLINPRQKAGTLALFAIIVAGAWWYRIPLHPLYRAMLFGFAAYLTLGTLLLSFLGLFSQWELGPRVLGALDTFGYVAASIWWARAAWRTSLAPSPVTARLQPWAHSW